MIVINASKRPAAESGRPPADRRAGKLDCNLYYPDSDGGLLGFEAGTPVHLCRACAKAREGVPFPVDQTEFWMPASAAKLSKTLQCPYINASGSTERPQARS